MKNNLLATKCAIHIFKLHTSTTTMLKVGILLCSTTSPHKQVKSRINNYFIVYQVWKYVVNNISILMAL
jgi:hypothetical protein